MDTAQEAPLPLFLLGVKLLSFDGVMLSAEVFCAWDARVYQVWKAIEGKEIEGDGLWREFGSKINLSYNWWEVRKYWQRETPADFKVRFSPFPIGIADNICPIS